MRSFTPLKKRISYKKFEKKISKQHPGSKIGSVFIGDSRTGTFNPITFNYLGLGAESLSNEVLKFLKRKKVIGYNSFSSSGNPPYLYDVFVEAKIKGMPRVSEIKRITFKVGNKVYETNIEVEKKPDSTGNLKNFIKRVYCGKYGRFKFKRKGKGKIF